MNGYDNHNNNNNNDKSSQVFFSGFHHLHTVKYHILYGKSISIEFHIKKEIREAKWMCENVGWEKRNQFGRLFKYKLCHLLIVESKGCFFPRNLTK